MSENECLSTSENSKEKGGREFIWQRGRLQREENEEGKARPASSSRTEIRSTAGTGGMYVVYEDRKSK